MNGSSRSRPVVLCVVDQETAVKLRKQVLEAAGYKVLSATSAHQALEIFRASRIDLVLIENVVPTMIDSTTLAATLRMLRPQVPIGIYSPDLAVSPEDRRFADEFITKLVSVEELVRIVERLLSRRGVARAKAG